VWQGGVTQRVRLSRARATVSCTRPQSRSGARNHSRAASSSHAS
jgi:hypothetical protein